MKTLWKYSLALSISVCSLAQAADQVRWNAAAPPPPGTIASSRMTIPPVTAPATTAIQWTSPINDQQLQPIHADELVLPPLSDLTPAPPALPTVEYLDLPKDTKVPRPMPNKPIAQSGSGSGSGGPSLEGSGSGSSSPETMPPPTPMGPNQSATPPSTTVVVPPGGPVLMDGPVLDGDYGVPAGDYFERGPRECLLSGLVFGLEWHILRPVINDNVAFTATTTTGSTTSTVRGNFDYNFQSDPSIWLGFRTECGLGITVTWFHLDNTSQDASIAATAATGVGTAGVFIGGPGGIIPPGSSVLFTDHSEIKMDIWDFDLTEKTTVGRFDVTFGAGIRYMRLVQTASGIGNVPALTVNVPNTNLPPLVTTPGTINANFSNSFSGTGPTIVLDGQRRIGCSAFSLYANTRGGVLFGAKHEDGSVSVSNPALAGLVTGGVTNSATSSSNISTVGFAEIELGIEWSKHYRVFAPFVRLGFEARDYWGIGNAVLATTGNNSSLIGAYGIALTAGLDY
jgi:hypothetical protein